jgi:lysophospholipase L1-like esterase
MKRIVFALVICSCFGSANSQSVRYDTIRYARKHYEKRVALFKTEPVQKGKVIFLGNSITEFGDWRKLLNDSTVINRGIAADNTFGVLDRLDDVIALQPSKLFLEIGINDISQSIPLDLIVKNIISIVTRVKSKSPRTVVYVVSILPTNDNVKEEYPEVFHKNEEANTVNNKLREKSKANHFVFLDLNKELRDKDGKLKEEYAEADGLHLNANGYQVWMTLL